MPHAKYDFAVWYHNGGARYGVVSRSFIGARCYFFPGIWFSRLAREQVIGEVLGTLKGVKPPRWRRTAALVGGDVPREAVECFVGYLMLDAWIGNTDRHSENWGFVEETGALVLAPTFDHASSLGVRLSDQDRDRRRTTRDKRASVASYAARCKTPFVTYDGNGSKRKMTAREVFRHAAQAYPQAAEFWLGRLHSLEEHDVGRIFSRIPPERISDAAVRFALALLEENRNKLLEGW